MALLRHGLWTTSELVDTAGEAASTHCSGLKGTTRTRMDGWMIHALCACMPTLCCRRQGIDDDDDDDPIQTTTAEDGRASVQQ